MSTGHPLTSPLCHMAETAATKPGTISAASLCDLTGLTDRRHRQLAAEGYFPNPQRGLYQLTPTIKGLFRYYNDQLHKKEDSYAQERKLLTRAKRLQEERQLAILDEQFWPSAEVAPALRNLSLHQRAVLQRKLEQELAPKLANQPYAKVRPMIVALVDDLCAIFRDGAAKWMADPPKARASADRLDQSG